MYLSISQVMFLSAGIILGLPFPRTNRYDNSFFPFSISNWNNLDSNIKSSSSLRGLATFHFPGVGGGGGGASYVGGGWRLLGMKNIF